MSDMVERIADVLIEDHVDLMQQLRIRCERNVVLHMALQDALTNRQGWQERAYELIMSTPYVPLSEELMAEIVGTDRVYSNERMKCVDCGKDGAKWRRLEGTDVGEPAFIKLCDECTESINKQAMNKQ